MNSEERFDHIEETIVQIVDIQKEQAQIQRQQAAVVLDVAQKQAAQSLAIHEVTEKLDALIAVVDKVITRNGK